MTTLQIINLAIMLAFFLCYSYQFFYIPVAWFKKDAPHREPSPHRIAVLIAARNEQSVIGNLIDSVKAQDYPTELVDVFVVADNCTDLTGSVAGAHGANVYFANHQSRHYAGVFPLLFLPVFLYPCGVVEEGRASP